MTTKEITATLMTNRPSSPRRKLAAALAGGLAAGALAVCLATPASADYDTAGYIDALEKAGVIQQGGDPRSHFTDGSSSLWTGVWVCQQVEQGRSRDSIVNDLYHSEGMLLSSHSAAAIYDAATTYLC